MVIKGELDNMIWEVDERWWVGKEFEEGRGVWKERERYRKILGEDLSFLG